MIKSAKIIFRKFCLFSWKEILISNRKLIYITTRKSFPKPLQNFEISIFDPEIFTIFIAENLQFFIKNQWLQVQKWFFANFVNFIEKRFWFRTENLFTSQPENHFRSPYKFLKFRFLTPKFSLFSLSKIIKFYR